MVTANKFELKMGAATRAAFGKALVELGHENPNVVVLDADLSKSTNTAGFAKEFPDRFFSCGIAEANMVAIGAGMASHGKVAFVSSFSCFVLNKGFEQLRVTSAYPQVPVKVVGTHSGISIGEDGPSQMSIEDIALACSLPGFTVIDPCDEISMKALVKGGAALPGSVFIRAGRATTPVVYAAGQIFEIGKSIELIAGTDLTVIAHGMLVAEAIRASQTLASEGLSVRVIDMHTIKPLDEEAIARAARETGAIVVAEEHLVDGGLGVRVAQAVSKSHPCIMEYVGINDVYAESGPPEAVLDKYGLLARDVIAACRRAVARKRG